MLDIRLVRDDPGALDAALSGRGADPCAASLLGLDEAWRSAVSAGEARKARLNAVSREVGQAVGRGDAARASDLRVEAAGLKAAAEGDEAAAAAARAALDAALLAIPNVPLPTVPVGPDETANVELRREGAPRVEGAWVRDHVAVGEPHGLDVEAGVRISGARFSLLRGQVARLERALGQFMLDLHVAEHGYEEVSPPLIVRGDSLVGTAQLPKFAEDLFRVDEDRWLVPTAEVPLTNVVRGLVLDEAALPLRLVALTPCFRSEAGSAGRDVRGLIRQHQFWKCELVSVTAPEASPYEHERMTAAAEEVLRRLGLPFRTVALCTGDMGFAAASTHDIEVWLPSQGTYREISSCSTCGDFQARRMDARYRPAEGKGTRHVHTLNGSGVAVGRALVAVLENYQREDGGVDVPDVLRPYMGGLATLAPR